MLDNSKQVVKALALTFIIITTACVGAFAISNIFSDHYTDDVNVPASPILMSVTPLPDAPAMNVEYALTFSVDFTVSAHDAYAILVISDTTGISSSDINVEYPDGTVITPIPGTNTLTYEIPIPAVDGNITFLVTFLADGYYAYDLSVEATA